MTSWLLPVASGRKSPTAQTSVGDEPAMAPTLLSEVPSSWVFWTVQPPALGEAVVIDVGSGGLNGVGVGQTSSGSGVVAIALEPVTANSAVSGLHVLGVAGELQAAQAEGVLRCVLSSE